MELNSTAASQAAGACSGVAGKVVLVTGASRGLGRVLLEQFATSGASVAFCARRAVDVQLLERELAARGHRVLGLPCDVRVESAIVRMVHRVFERFGRIDVLINAAAIRGPRLPIAEHPLDSWRDVVDTNLTGSYLVCREVIPFMLQQRGGTIINVVDAPARLGGGQWGAYSASKAGLEGMSRSLATELRDSGIRVNVVEPEPDRDPHGGHRTEIFVWLASDAARDVTGQRLRASAFNAASASTLTN